MEALFWLIAIVALLVIEIITLGLTTIWFAGGALAAFITALLGGTVFIQFVVFLAISFLLLFFTRPIAATYFNKQRVKTNVDSLIGQEARVTELIDNFNQKGKVVLNGLEWSARAEGDMQIEKDEKVKVLEIKGVKLIVTKLQQ